MIKTCAKWIFLSGYFSIVAACGGAEDFKEPPPPSESQVVIPSLIVDPVRGAQLFANTPKAGQLICADCHSDKPTLLNFGNIWSGRNAVALIQRAVSFNTGGMGYFSKLYTDADLADIAAYLGNSPNQLIFSGTLLGARSAAQFVTVSTSTKSGIAAVSIQAAGDFKIDSTTCTAVVPRFDSCTVQIIFEPQGRGQRNGALLITHDGTPAPIRIPLSGDGL